MLFCFLVLRHDRRKVMHFNVSEHPTEQWSHPRKATSFRARKSVAYIIAIDEQPDVPL